MAQDTAFATPFGSFELERYPRWPGDDLRAWNAADQLLLNAAASRAVNPGKILVVNDEHGALAVPLPGCTSWSDSRLSEIAARDNLQRNAVEPTVRFAAATEHPGEDYELVLLRVPKQLALLRYQLQVLRLSLPPGTTVIAAGMDKHLSPNTARLLEEHLGPTERHRGERRARFFTSRADPRGRTERDFKTHYHCAPLRADIVALPNVFSGDRLDVGSALLLDHWPGAGPARHVVDLGCGAGVLGLAAAAEQPEFLGFIDESALAVASAKRNMAALYPHYPGGVEFRQADGLLDYPFGQPDLVLLNPPFHDNHVVGEFVGRRLIRQAGRALASGGELWVVANRHLRYRTMLARAFDRVEQVAADRRFKLWRASRD